MQEGYHMSKIGVGDHQWDDEKYRSYWQSSTVAKILAKPEYAGHTVNLRTYKESYKDKKISWHDKEDWLIFENTHEAIIEQAIWDMAQKCRTVKRRPDRNGEANPLTGILHCADCGRRMYNHRGTESWTMDRGKSVLKKTKDHYVCSRYQIHRYDCTLHYTNTESVKAIILEAIRAATVYARENEAEFVKIIREASAVQQTEAAKNHKKQIAKNEKRIAELDTLFKKTYEDFSAGRLNEKRFALLSADYEAEQETLEKQTAELKAELEQFDSDSLRADKFLELARQYTELPELTAPILHAFVNRVDVHQTDRSSGKRVQQIDIHLNFIGQFQPPADETEADIEAEEKRAMWWEYKRNQREKAKQEKSA